MIYATLSVLMTLMFILKPELHVFLNDKHY